MPGRGVRGHRAVGQGVRDGVGWRRLWLPDAGRAVDRPVLSQEPARGGGHRRCPPKRGRSSSRRLGRSPTDDVYGMNIAQVAGDLGWSSWGLQYNAAGHLPITDDWSAASRHGAGLQGPREFYTTLYQEQLMPQEPTYGYADCSFFGEGTVAMSACGSWAIGQLAEPDWPEVLADTGHRGLPVHRWRPDQDHVDPGRLDAHRGRQVRPAPGCGRLHQLAAGRRPGHHDQLLRRGGLLQVPGPGLGQRGARRRPGGIREHVPRAW